MKPVKNIVRQYICPVTSTCRNFHLLPSGPPCTHQKPHLWGVFCMAGICGKEVTGCCLPVEEVLE